MFSWCYIGQHSQCRREYEKFIVDPKTNKIVMLGETVTCQCKKRGCKCYVPAAGRVKKTTRRRKK